VSARGFGWRRTLSGLVAGVAGVTGVVWALRPALTPIDLYVVAILVISAATAVVVSVLAGRMRRRAAEAESLALDVRRFAEEQAALRRVATRVAAGAPPAEVFEAVSAEVAALLGVDGSALTRYEPDGTMTTVSGWTPEGGFSNLGTCYPVEGTVSGVILDTGRPARLDRIADVQGEAHDAAREMGFYSAVGAPLTVDGRLWGVLATASKSEQPLTGLASWRPGGNGEPDVYVVGAAPETVGEVQRRTGSTHVEEPGCTVWVDQAHSFPPGQRLIVPGIRWHTAIAEDTRGQDDSVAHRVHLLRVSLSVPTG